MHICPVYILRQRSVNDLKIDPRSLKHIGDGKRVVMRDKAFGEKTRARVWLSDRSLLFSVRSCDAPFSCDGNLFTHHAEIYTPHLENYNREQSLRLERTETLRTPHGRKTSVGKRRKNVATTCSIDRLVPH